MSKKVLISVLILSVFVVGMNLAFPPSNILSWDVFGYYLYLPFTFIYQDLGLTHPEVVDGIMEKYNNTATFYQAMKMPDDIWVMKYSMGMAFLYAPFFFIGWLFAYVFNYPIDGFSAPFQYSIFIGGIVYSLIGLWFTAKVLQKFFTPKVTIVSLALIVFSTNYIVHVAMYGQNAMSQNYLFTGYAIVLWLTIKWNETYQLKFMVLLGVIIGLMALSRPTEIVALAIPVLWGVTSKETLITKIQVLWNRKSQVIIFALIVGVIGSFQLIYWKLFTGKFLFNSYGANAGEGLDLFSPYTFKFLFSFRKGWLLYTPIMLLAISGFYFMYRKKKEIFFSLFGYFVVNTWIVSSWSNWWYAQSFSQRAMVSSYPIMAIALGFFLTWLFAQKTILKMIGLGGITLFLGLNIFQTIQFDKGVLHGDRMTKEYYLATFGNLQVSQENKELLLVNRSFDGREKFTNEGNYSKSVLNVLNFDSGTGWNTEMAHSGCCVEKLDTDNIYTSFIEASYDELTQKDHAWIRVSAYVNPSEKDIRENSFSLVLHFMHKGYPYKYKTLEANEMKLVPNQWNKIEFEYLTPEVRKTTDTFRTLIWYRGNRSLLVDDLKVEVFEKK